MRRCYSVERFCLLNATLRLNTFKLINTADISALKAFPVHTSLLFTLNKETRLEMNFHAITNYHATARLMRADLKTESPPYQQAQGKVSVSFWSQCVAFFAFLLLLLRLTELQDVSVSAAWVRSSIFSCSNMDVTFSVSSSSFRTPARSSSGTPKST